METALTDGASRKMCHALPLPSGYGYLKHPSHYLQSTPEKTLGAGGGRPVGQRLPWASPDAELKSWPPRAAGRDGEAPGRAAVCSPRTRRGAVLQDGQLLDDNRPTQWQRGHLPTSCPQPGPVHTVGIRSRRSQRVVKPSRLQWKITRPTESQAGLKLNERQL